jgi:lipid-A-disaccharide synthase
MVIAGEASGDWLAAELVKAIREEMAQAPGVPTTDNQPLRSNLAPRFFGAGGPLMAAAGVELLFDLTKHSVIGVSDVLKKYFQLRPLFKALHLMALERQPDVIICVDFSDFNRRFARAVQKSVRSRSGRFYDWRPKLVKYVSPQVWASRENRAYQIASDHDLVLSLFPFEKAWYARKVPKLKVEFVGDPMVDRYGPTTADEHRSVPGAPLVLLLPGSRTGELARHLEVMLGALEILKKEIAGLRSMMVLPNEDLIAQAKTFALPSHLEIRYGGLPDALRQADVAIASTGTVTRECAYFGVPTVAIYKTSWLTYAIGKQIVKVKYLAMPNILANEPVFPEFIQNAATAENIAEAASDLLQDKALRTKVVEKLGEIARSLGSPGASQRAAKAILSLIGR